MPEAAASSDVGTYFGKYFLMKKLAAGGMGEVFIAKQQGPAGFQKVLVVKKILGHLTESKEFTEAFLGEARLAAQMNHRNIVQVFELGEHDRAYFIAMEYVQGKSLRDVIDTAMRRKERIPAELCRTVVEQICDGASYAHNLTDMMGRSLNLVHRDLNPQNVLISYTGDVKIIDFGIAKSELSTVKTEAGMIKGKFVYMSPEQSLAKKLDKRSDIFAIGISLYEMITGVNPFHKNNIVLTLEAVQRYEPPPPSEYDPSYAPFDPIISKALAKDRDRRYSDAAEMQDDLRRVVLPRPTERLGQFMCRMFRTQLEEEQKLLMDSDRAKLVGGAPARTPPRAAQTPPRPSAASIPTVPDLSSVQGGTQLLPNAAARGKAPAAAPADDRPARAVARSSPPRRPAGAGDTLVDMDAGGPPAHAADELPGGTAMLKPGQALPPPGKAGPRPIERPVEKTEELAPVDGAGGTVILSTPPKRAAAKNAELPKKQASTNILTPEETEAAQREAQAKLEQARKGVVRTRTRNDKIVELTQARTSRGMWIALGIGTLAAVALIVGLLFLFFAEESAAPQQRSRRFANPPVAQAIPAAEPDAEEKVAPVDAKEPARRQVGSGRALGMLMLNPGPNVPVVFGGIALPKQVGAFNLPVTAGSGTIEVGDDSTPFHLTLAYAVSGAALNVKVHSAPRAVATVNGHAAAEARIDKTMSVVEVKRPGAENGMTLRLHYKAN
jgi:serine/threonine protein kinase